MQKKHVHLSRVNSRIFDLLSVTGIAVTTNDYIYYGELDEGQKQTMTNKSLEIASFDTMRSSTVIKEIHISLNNGILVKMQGELNTSVEMAIGKLIMAMRNQKMTSFYCPGFTKTQKSSWLIGSEKLNFQLITDLNDAKVYHDKVIFCTVHEPKILRSVAFLDMKARSNYVTVSEKLETFTENIRGLGRISQKTFSMPITLDDSGHIFTYHVIGKKVQVADIVKAPEHSVYMGIYRLCDKFDHAVSMCVSAGKMMFATPDHAMVSNR
jgi:hypothetical protein